MLVVLVNVTFADAETTSNKAEQKFDIELAATQHDAILTNFPCSGLFTPSPERRRPQPSRFELSTKQSTKRCR